MVGDIERGVILWRGGGAHQFHPSLLWGFTCLVTITTYAGANHIFPGVFATSVAWKNMVKGKLPAFFPTILAHVVVAVENLKAS